MENIKDSTWDRDLTLHAVAVLDNVDVVITNAKRPGPLRRCQVLNICKRPRLKSAGVLVP
eukprot:5038648-Pleurochrysis_carterae.AAC.1